MLQKRIKDGDRQAFAQAYDMHFERVYSLAFKYTGNIEVSSDIVQDTFLKLWNNRSSVSLELPLEQQVFVIAKNVVFDHFRKRIREENFLSTYNDLGFLDDLSEANEIRRERLKKLIDAIEHLPPRQKEIFELSKIQGLTYLEIAQRLNVSKHTVSSHISAAMKGIKKRLLMLFF